MPLVGGGRGGRRERLLGALNGALVGRARPARDRRDPGHDGGAARERCAGRPKASWVQDLPGGLPVVRPRPGRRPRRDRRSSPLAGLGRRRLGPAPSRRPAARSTPTGSDAEAARLAGIRPRRVVFGVFVLMGGAHRPGRAAHRHPVHRRADQRRRRPRAEGHRGGRRGRHGDRRRPRHARWARCSASRCSAPSGPRSRSSAARRTGSARSRA